ncbi:MAG TPA: ABC transporter substrate-binding protein [Actinomycetota bacterium]|nr:ABC transporter substrate-binding protein [Actinomycetota bacterium]
MRKIVQIVLLLALAACSTSNPKAAETPAPGTSFPLTLVAANGSVTIKAKPASIISLSPTATEMLFAIGAGAQVKAVDDQSNYPPQAPKTKLSGFQPNVEAIANYQPDLVVISGDLPGLSASLNKLSIPVLVEPAAKDLNDTYNQIVELGRATGHEPEADTLVSTMKGRIQAILASAPKFASPPTYYHELDNTYFTATSHTFIGTVYGLLGMKNIADPADKKASGYPQLSAEYIIQTNPQIIFLADTKCCGQSLSTVRKRPGWSQMTAVRDGRVIALDDDVASRWGPRIVDFLQTVVNALQELKQAA